MAAPPPKKKGESPWQRKYPYTRGQECSWQPEEVARHLAALLPSVAPSMSMEGGPLLLISQGWASSTQVSLMRAAYGKNLLHQQSSSSSSDHSSSSSDDDDDDEEECEDDLDEVGRNDDEDLLDKKKKGEDDDEIKHETTIESNRKNNYTSKRNDASFDQDDNKPKTGKRTESSLPRRRKKKASGGLLLAIRSALSQTLCCWGRSCSSMKSHHHHHQRLTNGRPKRKRHQRRHRRFYLGWWRKGRAWLLTVTSALLSQLKEPLILMLLGSAALSLILGNTADALSIALALTIVSAVAAIQEVRSEAALEKLQQLVPPTCTVLRQGRVLDHTLARDLVLGDLVLLSTGDRVPADCRVVDSVELTVDESSLTGENHPVVKTSEAMAFSKHPLPAPPALTDQHNIVFAGTLVLSGRGRALVVAVGPQTEFGKVATELSQVTARKSPLQIKMDELSQRLATLSSLAIAMIAILGWWMGRPLLETITVAVSLAVAAIPEGLPICVTVTLALGVLRMARRNAICKKLPVVEALGCTTAVACDKTGTLTQNEMTVRSVFTLAFPEIVFKCTGVGYQVGSGRFVDTPLPASGRSLPPQLKELSGRDVVIDEQSPEREVLSALFYTGCLCNNATWSMPEGDVSSNSSEQQPSMSGQPTELALLVASAKAGLADPRPQYHRLQEIPFSSERKRMEVRARPVNGNHVCVAFTHASLACEPSLLMLTPGRRLSTDGSLYFIKGMPEKVLDECQSFLLPNATMHPFRPDHREQVIFQAKKMASTGLRVLALAYGPALGYLTFAGLVGMEDPPRHGVAKAVRELRSGGVKVMMVTGDSKETAMTIARRCGILGPVASESEDQEVEDVPAGLEDLILSVDSGISSGSLDEVEMGTCECLSGSELDALSAHELSEIISDVKVFYRVIPQHKLAIVRALQAKGEIVALSGDGVNDAIALKGADIGIAMGLKGTDVAKEAADVVLADDDFCTITMAIAQGKGIFFNIRCFLAFQLSTSFAALTMASVATAFGLPSPLNAMQILWINIIMDGPPAQSLGVEPVSPHILQAPPRQADDPIVTRALLLRAMSSAMLIVFLTLKVFANELDDGRVSKRDTTMTFMTFVNCDLFNAYVCRSAERCFYELPVYGNPAFLWSVGGSLVGQLLVIYWPPLQQVFQTQSLAPRDLLYIVLLSSNILWLDTLRKKFFLSIFADQGVSSLPESWSGGEAGPPSAHNSRTSSPAGRRISRRHYSRSWLSLGKGSVESKAQ